MILRIFLNNISLLLLLLAFGSVKAQENILEEILRNDTSALVRKVLENKDRYRLQIVYTQINRDANNEPHLQTFQYRVKSEEYFYTASLVKLPCAAFALERIRSMNVKGLNFYTPFKPVSNYKCFANSKYLKKEKPESLSQLISKLFVLSDNNAYNWLYELLGQQYIHQRFSEMGYDSARIIKKFTPCSPSQARSTGPMVFYTPKGHPFYRQALEVCSTEYKLLLANTVVGEKHEENNKIVNFGMDFRTSNFISLPDLHEMVIAINLPQSLPENKRFKLEENDYALLRKYMGMYPRELSAQLKEDKYPDAHLKFLFAGGSKTRIDPNIRIFNKVGEYLGFLSDCAYIVDYEQKVEFFLSAVIYVNEDQILNDGKYEYFSEGCPFLAKLGQIVYQYEIGRQKEFVPKLKRLGYK